MNSHNDLMALRRPELTARHIRVVTLDLPTSWMIAAKAADEFTGRTLRSAAKLPVPPLMSS